MNFLSIINFTHSVTLIMQLNIWSKLFFFLVLSYLFSYKNVIWLILLPSMYSIYLFFFHFFAEKFAFFSRISLLACWNILMIFVLKSYQIISTSVLLLHFCLFIAFSSSGGSTCFCLPSCPVLYCTLEGFGSVKGLAFCPVRGHLPDPYRVCLKPC